METLQKLRKKDRCLLALDMELDVEKLDKEFFEELYLFGYDGLILDFRDVKPIYDLVNRDVYSLFKDKIFIKFHFSHKNSTLNKREAKKNIRRIKGKLDKLDLKYALSIDDTYLSVLNPNELYSLNIKVLKLQRVDWRILNKLLSHPVFFEVSLKKLMSDELYSRNIYPKLEILEKKGKLLFSQYIPYIPVKFMPYIVNIITSKKVFGYGPLIRWWGALNAI